MFKNLCYKHNFNSNQSISHVLMDGGVLSVPFDKLNVKDCDLFEILYIIVLLACYIYYTAPLFLEQT